MATTLTWPTYPRARHRTERVSRERSWRFPSVRRIAIVGAVLVAAAWTGAVFTAAVYICEHQPTPESPLCFVKGS
jgi:hypothetical protein